MSEFPETFNLVTHHLDKHIHEENGERIAIRYGDESLTYQDIFNSVNRFGNALLSLGVTMEQRVCTIMPDQPEFIISWLATLKIGGVVNTLNPLYPAEDVAPYFKHIRPTVLVNLKPSFLRLSPSVR